MIPWLQPIFAYQKKHKIKQTVMPISNETKPTKNNNNKNNKQTKTKNKQTVMSCVAMNHA